MSIRIPEHCQLLIVTNNSWDDKQGNLQLFERIKEERLWSLIGESIPVVLGEAGMAWGVGLHPVIDKTSPYKMEGDLKSPAGIFSLGSAFGFLPISQMTHLRIDYLQLNEFIEAVDDSRSFYYNQIVDSREVIVDWHSAEKMRNEPLYEMGLIINHNWPDPQPGRGSAIFFHIWQHEARGTAGCTAMSQQNLEKVISWVDRNRSPLLIQVPYFIYSKLQTVWQLPKLKIN